MRPVSKGTPDGTYPINLRVDTLIKFRNDAKKIAIWNFNTAAVNDAFGTYSPTAWDMLDGLLTIKTWGKKKRTKQLDNLENAQDVMETQLSDTPKGYKQAAPLLLGRIGKICSYCEQFLPDDADVEHCIPKGEFPYTWIAWPNFLTACGACNTNGTGKGTGPSRKTVQKWGTTPTKANEIQLYQSVRNRYIWPDVNAASYRLLTPALWYLDDADNTWKQADDADSVGLDAKIGAVDPQTRQVNATLKIGVAAAKSYRVKVLLSAGTTQATDSVTYFGLDRPGTASSSVRDMRMYNRTVEWFTTLRPMRRLQNANAGNFDDVLSDVVEGLRHRGYFSVWIRVASLMIGTGTVDPTDPTRTVVKALLAKIAAEGALVWPGTNTTQVP